MIVLKIIIGVIAGVIGGMGMGGGTILIPLLVLFCDTNQHVAQSINLAGFVPMCIVCIIIHFKNKLIDIKTAIKVGIPASVGGVLGSIVALSINADTLGLYFGIFLLILGAYQIIHTIYIIRNEILQKRNNKSPKNIQPDL